jgi:N-acetylmuramoyl-L-alanine amidase
MRLGSLRWLRILLLLVIGVALLGAGWSAWQSTHPGAGLVWGPLRALAGVESSGWHIGIVAGHSGNDSGAVCPDGLTEAEVNRTVAEAVSRQLRRRGAAVDLLEEFDGRLTGYRADAFVSIHADSCEVDMSGFKVANLEGGSVASEQLVACLWDRYEATTGLTRHPNTITYDMRKYHAFEEIARKTPAAIIEIGFLKGDRKLLTKNPERVAAGIVAGIECFLNPGE